MMIRSTQACSAVLLLLTFCASTRAAILINEIYANPIGTDNNREFIELVSTTGGPESMAGMVLLLIDANGINTGTIDDAYSLNSYSTGSNGLLAMGNDYDVDPPGPLAGPWNGQWADPSKGNQQTALKDPSGATPFSGLGVGDLSNNALVALLVSGFSSSAGTDLDVDNDGVFDFTPWSVVHDSIAIAEGTGPALAGQTYGVPTIADQAYTADTIARFRSDITPNSVSSWYGGDLASDLAYDPVENFGLPPDAAPTPTYANLPVPEPAGALLTGTAAAALLLTTRGRRTTGSD
jgi:hypothetical protein